MGKQCYVCHKEMGSFIKNTLAKWTYTDYLNQRIPVPDGMKPDDVTCNSCMQAAGKTNKEETKEVKIQESALMLDIIKRVPEYKKHWNKNGVIQFKNDQIAILKRIIGAQVEFIIAFDDLTTQGYELKVTDPGAEVGQGLSGGLSSYYYFQKLKQS